MKKYIKQNLIAIDQLANTILAGYADETLSSRMYRYERNGYLLGKILRPTIDIIFFFDPDHCFESYKSEVTRRHFPKEFRS